MRLTCNGLKYVRIESIRGYGGYGHGIAIPLPYVAESKRLPIPEKSENLDKL
ncbi:hypothetical protein MiSe_62520 [Microseira wollei NIES-4236]|uniref:Uncharacterized protein n=1 Tax=Microseira wollei NIES-4236 TaxID=2530354 RepID=A0AAV3XMP4_9CYAN|nr:hypothetical protein MiSe_62520 [Microseira wollei NIES-4236]